MALSDVADAVQIIQNMVATINPKHSVDITVYNYSSDITLQKATENIAHGTYGSDLPSPQIPPGQADNFIAVDASWSIGTGTEGRITYYAVDSNGFDAGFTFTVYWDNPFWGENKGNASLAPSQSADNTGNYHVQWTIGGGDNAKAWFALYAGPANP